MDEWTGRWMNGQVDGRMDSYMDEWTGRWMNGQVDGRMDRQMDKWTGRWTSSTHELELLKQSNQITHEHYPFDNTQNFNLQIVRNMITAEMATNHKKVIVTILRDNWSQVMQLP